MKIVVENSTWNNIGDAFYQFPLYKILKNTLKQHDVYMFDGPIYRSFKIPNTNFFKKKNIRYKTVYRCRYICIFWTNITK